MTIGDTSPDTAGSLDLLEDVSARARSLGIGLVAYPVEDVEAVCAALRSVRREPVASATAEEAST